MFEDIKERLMYALRHSLHAHQHIVGTQQDMLCVVDDTHCVHVLYASIHRDNSVELSYYCVMGLNGLRVVQNVETTVAEYHDFCVEVQKNTSI